MNKITSFLTFSLVLVYHLSYAQVDSYFKAIYAAEEKIMDSSFQSAVAYYKDAFEFSEQILFAKDVHNAMLCAFYIDDKESFTSFVNLYRKFDLLEIFIEARYKKLLSEKYYDILTSEPSTFSKVDSLCRFLNRLLTLDQAIRKSCIEDKNCFDCSVEMGKLDSINLRLVIKHIENHGYPMEWQICSHNPFSLGTIDLVVLHNTGPKCENCHMLLKNVAFPLLKKEVIAGRLHPQMYAGRIDQLMDSGKLGSHIYGAKNSLIIDNRLFLFPIGDQNELNKANKERSQINLDDHDIFLKKIAFQFFHPEFNLVYHLFLPNLDIRGEAKDAMINQIKVFEITKATYGWE